MNTPNDLRIEVNELRRIATRLFDALEESEGDAVDLAADYFYSVPIPELYDVSGDVPQLTIGQLTESWSNLRTANDSSIPWEFVWFGDVLKAIGHRFSV
ncbi:hypothetical protein [Agromyces larvae]|uniref:Uncharacterized protein n=1 Tax=Agromyces larvae TaxID=2929802 RepID=A0ABY4BYC1_9MICO|nr:hypothetical protein [Agromyces larvae]UOE42718.1 hypothetical protein MTO99_11000 [Agromyces larvae]